MLRAAAMLAVVLAVPAGAGAQKCAPGDEFCDRPPPCYREPDDPECNPDCTCDAPDYPDCDPFCAAGDICDPDCGNPCWDEFGRDVCTDIPDPCVPTGDPPFEFIDDMDGDPDDGQIVVLADREPTVSCGTIRVDVTGYYSIYDTELSESCDEQRDETGYVTIRNSCNTAGWAVERNAGDRFLVFDSDNTPDCASDADCEVGKVCRVGTGGRDSCCVPDTPVFMGTFLLVEGEDNRICINHWCPDWQMELSAGRDFGFVVDGCRGINSIHFQVGDSAFACEDDTTLQPCSWGCVAGECLPDPCLEVDCRAFCMDGICRDDNPCEDVVCEYGCVRGRCLQSPHARGPDADEDGYTAVADCDDTDPEVNPGHDEICDNALDDDCDGRFDEADCEAPGDGDAGPARPGMDGGSGGADAGRPRPGTSTTTSGCGCRVGAQASGSWLALALLAPLARRRRR